MIRKLFKNFLVAISLSLFALFACTNNDGEQLELTANINGIHDGKAIITYDREEINADTVSIKNGKFTYTANYPEPKQIYIKLADKRGFSCFVQNGKMAINGHIDSLQKIVITGCMTQDDAQRMQDMTEEVEKRLNINALAKELYTSRVSKTLTEEREMELDIIMEQYSKEVDIIRANFIKENPKSYYSAILVSQIVEGKNAEGIEEWIAILDKSLLKTQIGSKILEQMEQAKKTGISFTDFIPNAHNLSYAVDKTYIGNQITGAIYLSILSNDNLCCLKGDGTVVILSPKGEKIAEYKSDLKSKPSVIATDNRDNIYVFGTKLETKEQVSRGKTYKVENPLGIECLVLDPKGRRIREMRFEETLTATGIRISENNLIIADTKKAKIDIFDLETGAKKSTVNNLRTCCGILDFTIRNNSEILVANLGNFRVDGFDFYGEPIISFGQRGTGIDDFHGCCNPVSVECLSNGGIVTVEKDPTRIKVYSNEGAKQIDGIEELVKGCAHIPIVRDSRDNIYLASKESGLVKCIMITKHPL